MEDRGGRMAGITTTVERGVSRIYCTFSYRDGNNKPQHIRKLIGKIDKNASKPVFNDYFINLINHQNISIDEIYNTDLYNIPKIVNFGVLNKETMSIDNFNNINISLDNILPVSDNNNGNNADNNGSITLTYPNNNTKTYDESKYQSKIYGHSIILEAVLDKIGLLKILKDIFPTLWASILTLALYLVIKHEALMYCENWQYDTEFFYDCLSLKSQRISEVLHEISYTDVMNFYEAWSKYRTENEYLALDITSISSYSNLISYIEHGYNRDEENLPQINFCLLFGEKSGLPVFSHCYPGSIKDVSTLKSFIDQVDYVNDQSCKLVMDKGFYSQKNLLYLLKNDKKHKFLVAVPFTTCIAKELVELNKSKFNENLSFKVGQDILTSYSIIKNFNIHNKLKYHVYYNHFKYENARQNKKNISLLLADEAQSDPLKYKNSNEHKKYLTFTKSDELNKYDISIKMDRILHELRNTGMLIIVTNDFELDNKDVINIYRNKDVVEKAFNRLKNILEINRLHVHSDKAASSKLFISTISLIIVSSIHKTMIENNLYNNFTMASLFKELEKIKIYKSGNNESISPISKVNRQILASFGIKCS
jgi:transposase